MKKCYIADLLTLSEVIFAGILTIMGLKEVSADIALWMFALGELCDAFDGMAARRWHYPDDGKIRWWRVYAPEIDQISDILIMLAAAFYMVFGLNKLYYIHITCITVIFCLFVELATKREAWFNHYAVRILRFFRIIKPERISHDSEGRKYTSVNYAEKVILFRRYIYLGVIALLVVTLIYATSWPEIVKYLLTGVGIVVAGILIVVKQNHLTQDKTPL